MSELKSQFYDHEVVQQSPNDYVEINIAPAAILKAWSSSIFAHELLAKDGRVKDETDMHAETLKKYLDTMEAMKRGEGVAKPILGIGIMDNLEIGLGREIIAAAHNAGIKTIPSKIRKSQADEIKSLLE